MNLSQAEVVYARTTSTGMLIMRHPKTEQMPYELWFAHACQGSKYSLVENLLVIKQWSSWSPLRGAMRGLVLYCYAISAFAFFCEIRCWLLLLLICFFASRRKSSTITSTQRWCGVIITRYYKSAWKAEWPQRMPKRLSPWQRGKRRTTERRSRPSVSRSNVTVCPRSLPNCRTGQHWSWVPSRVTLEPMCFVLWCFRNLRVSTCWYFRQYQITFLHKRNHRSRGGGSPTRVLYV